jgi:Mn2+/Fe2+ NRAMP family transporter
MSAFSGGAAPLASSSASVIVCALSSATVEQGFAKKNIIFSAREFIDHFRVLPRECMISAPD